MVEVLGRELAELERGHVVVVDVESVVFVQLAEQVAVQHLVLERAQPIHVGLVQVVWLFVRVLLITRQDTSQALKVA